MADIGWTTEYVKKFFQLYGVDDFGLFYLDQDEVDGDTLNHSMDDVLAILGIHDPVKVASIEREWRQIVSLDLIPQIALKNIKPNIAHPVEEHHEELEDVEHIMARTFDFSAVDNFVLESNSAKLSKQENKIEHLSQKLSAMTASEANTNALITSLRREINDLHISSIKDKRDKQQSEDQVKLLMEEVQQLKFNSPKERPPPTVFVESEPVSANAVVAVEEVMVDSKGKETPSVVSATVTPSFLTGTRHVDTSNVDDDVLIREQPLTPAVDASPLHIHKNDSDPNLHLEFNELLQGVIQQPNESVDSLSDDEDAEVDAQFNKLIAAATQSKNTKMIQYLFDKNNRRSIRKSLRSLSSSVAPIRPPIVAQQSEIRAAVNSNPTSDYEALIDSTVPNMEPSVGPVKSQYENEEDMRWFTGYKPVRPSEGSASQHHQTQQTLPQPPQSAGNNRVQYPNRPGSGTGRPYIVTSPTLMNAQHQQQQQQQQQQQRTSEALSRSHATHRITDHIKQMYDNIDEYYAATELSKAKVLRRQKQQEKEMRDKKNIQNRQWFHDPRVLHMPPVDSTSGSRPVSASAVYAGGGGSKKRPNDNYERKIQNQHYHDLTAANAIESDARLFSVKEKCYAEHISDLVHIIDDLTLANNKIIKSMIQSNIINTNAQLLSANINMLQSNEQPLFPQRPRSTSRPRVKSASQFYSRTNRIKQNTEPYVEYDDYGPASGGQPARWDGVVRDGTEIYETEPPGGNNIPGGQMYPGLGRYHGYGIVDVQANSGVGGVTMNEYLLQEELSSLLDSDDYIFPTSQQIYVLNNADSLPAQQGMYEQIQRFDQRQYQQQQGSEQNSSDLSNSRKEPQQPRPPPSSSHRGRAVTSTGVQSSVKTASASGGMRAVRKTVPAKLSRHHYETEAPFSSAAGYSAMTENVINYRVDSALERGATAAIDPALFGEDVHLDHSNNYYSDDRRRPKSATGTGHRQKKW